MVKKIALVCFIVFIIAAAFPLMPVFGQQEDEFANVLVRLWPEYDQPEMLVIYDLTLPAGTPLPATITMRIPVTAAAPHAVASRQPDGSLNNLPFDKPVMMGSWQEVEFEATTLESQFEYYDSGLRKDGEQRTYQYIWPGNFGVQDFNIEFQQPDGASEVVLTPNLGNAFAGVDGLTYYQDKVGSLEPGQEYKLAIEYAKSDDSLSAETLKVDPVTPIEGGSSARSALSSALPWLMAILVIAIIAGGFWYWHASRKESKSEPRRRHKPASERSGIEVIEEGGVYCHQCGRRASQGDRFCRTCGTQLRV
jgi:hypothetical protein